MKVFIKNKLVSLGGSSTVKDESMKDVFAVKGKVMSISKKKRICDMNGNVLYTVRNKMIRFFSHSVIIYDGDKNKIARVKHPAFSVKKFIVEGYKDEITINGEFLSRRSEIVRNGKTIGTIDREFTIMTDAFCLEGDEADIPFLIALVIGIDNIYDRITKSR